ncbi:MAG: PEP-CTERM sorting domain-containing protein [Undibacterium sp.]|jgi:hypothetical protein|nr:PEP-CTERM sorting domain-containing protein [Undibacterium sp.]MDO8700974.1 PEP-CTERM sorting domain-containing protein [Undibacterium sp.]
MKINKFLTTVGLLFGIAMAPVAQATIITFTGGTVSGGGNVYEENGFRIEAIGGGASFGDYYGVGNNVIHGHWQNGCCGNMTKILVTKIDGSAFDLNYFILTSNTNTGGGRADGTEKAYIHASSDGVADDYSQLLPPEDWGFPASQIFLGSQFDSVKAFWFTQNSGVDCFGMDSFYINEVAPPNPNDVPEPATLALVMISLLAFGASRRRNIK